jgi:multidrug efflux pump subunit AcrB
MMHVLASKSRLTPIFLTTLTTIVSLLPLAFQKSLTWSPLALTIIGGLVVSTLISLVLVPLLYTLFTSAIAPSSVEMETQLQDIKA